MTRRWTTAPGRVDRVTGASPLEERIAETGKLLVPAMLSGQASHLKPAFVRFVRFVVHPPVSLRSSAFSAVNSQQPIAA